mmetsp:Transcript_79017/g.232001  ORF Transcript_79017/g.232001 Transcript_79017/m.232001 type:complete len:200 (-) Transcript_79017:39-638(-)
MRGQPLLELAGHGRLDEPRELRQPRAPAQGLGHLVSVEAVHVLQFAAVVPLIIALTNVTSLPVCVTHEAVQAAEAEHFLQAAFDAVLHPLLLIVRVARQLKVDLLEEVTLGRRYNVVVWLLIEDRPNAFALTSLSSRRRRQRGKLLHVAAFRGPKALVAVAKAKLEELPVPTAEPPRVGATHREGLWQEGRRGHLKGFT